MEDQDKKTVNTAPAENGANVQADVDEIMKNTTVSQTFVFGKVCRSMWSVAC